MCDHNPKFLSYNDTAKYNDHQYVEAAKLIEKDSRVDNLDLCNFDTEHLDEIIRSGVKVISNQVQVCIKIFHRGHKEID